MTLEDRLEQAVRGAAQLKMPSRSKSTERNRNLRSTLDGDLLTVAKGKLRGLT